MLDGERATSVRASRTAGTITLSGTKVTPGFGTLALRSLTVPDYR
jgi:hypothetical protein